MYLFGDFNNWNKCAVPFKKLDFGKWELRLKPNGSGQCQVPHLSKLKLVIKSHDREIHER